MKLLKMDGRMITMVIEDIFFKDDLSVKIKIKDNREKILSIKLEDSEIKRIIMEKLIE